MRYCGISQSLREEQTGKKRKTVTRKREKEPTFLEKQAMEGLMSRCGTKDSEDTVFMEKAAGAATATVPAVAEILSRVNPIQEKRKTKIGKKRSWLCLVFSRKMKSGV